MCEEGSVRSRERGAGSRIPKAPFSKRGGRGGIPVFDEQITVNVLNDFNDIYDFNDS